MPPERTPVYTNRLQCVECGRVSRENERGWKARLTVDDEVVVYCVRRAGIFEGLELEIRCPPPQRLSR
jgi:hypothetical protein